MNWRGKITSAVWILVTVLVIAIQFFAWMEEPEAPTPSAMPEYREMAQQLSGARLVEDDINDGDSFKIAHAGGAHVFRLYYVDCPEKRQYELVNARLKDQASYFGGLTLPQTMEIGKEAAEFTTGLLRRGGFQLVTRWERVFQSERFYAFVVYDDGEHLAEKLVRAGLCRIFTKGAKLPDGRMTNDFETYLRTLETEARSAQVGAWNVSKRRQTKRKK